MATQGIRQCWARSCNCSRKTCGRRVRLHRRSCSLQRAASAWQVSRVWACCRSCSKSPMSSNCRSQPSSAGCAQPRRCRVVAPRPVKSRSRLCPCHSLGGPSTANRLPGTRYSLRCRAVLPDNGWASEWRTGPLICSTRPCESSCNCSPTLGTTGRARVSSGMAGERCSSSPNSLPAGLKIECSTVHSGWSAGWAPCPLPATPGTESPG